MSSDFTGNIAPLSCFDIQRLPKRQDICYACLSGTFCDDDGSNCKNLDGCKVDGTQQCSFFERCQEDSTMSIRENSRKQIVTRCKLDPIRVASFVIGLVMFLLTLFLITRFVFLQKRTKEAALRHTKKGSLEKGK